MTGNSAVFFYNVTFCLKKKFELQSLEGPKQIHVIIYSTTNQVPTFGHSESKSHDDCKNRVCADSEQSTKKSPRNAEDYEYIQKSKVPTMHFQASLPRLPIPKLEDSCRKYLDAQKPLLNEEQFEFTKSCVNKFLESEGRTLHKELLNIDKKNRHTSYISEYWFDMYLRDRQPLPINYNPMIVYSQETDERYNDQLVKATNLVVSSIRFLKSLRAGILEPEVFHLNPKKSNTEFFRTFTGMLPSWISWYGAFALKAYPLDMSQYANLFNSTRIPEQGKDRISLDKSARHMVVMRGGHFYAFDILNQDGTIISPKKVAANLNFILQSKTSESESPVGILTGAERNQWAEARAHLSKIGNQEILKKIDSAAFVLVLDDQSIGDETDDGDYRKLVRHFLHGDGTNRWFDKSFSLIITKDGFAGLNFEHSWGDGVAILRYFQDVKADITKNPWFRPEDRVLISNVNPQVESLEFNLDGKMKEIIQTEQEKYRKWIDSLSVAHVIYEGFGKEECKKFGVSPDAIMQLAFQLALYKQEGRSVATYESCSTSAFKHGRTETIRPCTEYTKSVCSTMVNKNSGISAAELKKMIVDCSKAHTELVKNAAMGQGFDRHLFALKRMQEKLGKKTSLFEDPAYTAINQNILSTSTLSAPIVIAGGFGPVVPDGFGIAYMIQDKRLGAVVTSYSKHRSANDYVKNLQTAFEDIHKVMVTP